MKNLKFILFAFCLFIASCIPSLHPIYTTENTLIDDRITGKWFTEKTGVSKKDLEPYKDKDIKIHVKKLEIIGDSLYQFSSFDMWQFDRAANIRYEKINENGSSSNTAQFDHPMSQIDSSLLADGYHISEIEKLDYYILQYKDLKDEEAGVETMIVHLTEINNDIYMDFEPHPDFRSESRFSINHIPAHTFAKVEFNEDRLVMKSFNSEFIEELIKNKRVRLKHERIEDAIILTASTEELRGFIEKYGNESKLYADDEILLKI